MRIAGVAEDRQLASQHPEPQKAPRRRSSIGARRDCVADLRIARRHGTNVRLWKDQIAPVISADVNRAAVQVTSRADPKTRRGLPDREAADWAALGTYPLGGIVRCLIGRSTFSLQSVGLLVLVCRTPCNYSSDDYEQECSSDKDSDGCQHEHPCRRLSLWRLLKRRRTPCRRLIHPASLSPLHPHPQPMPLDTTRPSVRYQRPQPGPAPAATEGAGTAVARPGSYHYTNDAPPNVESFYVYSDGAAPPAPAVTVVYKSGGTLDYASEAECLTAEIKPWCPSLTSVGSIAPANGRSRWSADPASPYTDWTGTSIAAVGPSDVLPGTGGGGGGR
jgi:hypothetical protein